MLGETPKGRVLGCQNTHLRVCVLPGLPEGDVHSLSTLPPSSSSIYRDPGASLERDSFPWNFPGNDAFC